MTTFRRYLIEEWWDNGTRRHRVMRQDRFAANLYPNRDLSDVTELVRLANYGYLAEQRDLRAKARARKAAKR